MCDTLCALAPASATRRTVLAKNSDRPPTEAQPLEWHPPRDEAETRTTYLAVEGAGRPTVGVLGSRPSWIWGFEHGVNEAGVAIGNEAVWTTVDAAGAPDALIGMDLVRLGLERATSAAGAVEVMTALLERYGQGGACHPDGGQAYWSSFLVADADSAVVLETSGREWATEDVRDTRAISNRLTIPEFHARLHPDTGGLIERFVDPRLEASDDLLGRAPGDLAATKAHLRSHVGNDGYSVCMHAPAADATTASMIVELGGDRPRGWFLLGRPCRSVYVPLWVGRPLGDVPAWERFAGLTDADREAARALEAELERDGRDDDAWGPEAWRRVDAFLAARGR
ncbi:MAG: C69 family dipeptidase [Acidimicrobiales bacterium]|nr:C69 family dipeptidase [Acidimicrobiales bacterium]MCB1014728.1 C69 family dipeptidase [Acidimicrobiales bacterium]